MGQCKVCGKTTKDGLEYCEECQKELDQIDLDAGSFDDSDFSLDDLEFQELSGDLLETDLEFQLEDPENDLENPQIVVREKEEYSEESAIVKDVSEVEVPSTEEVPSIEEMSLDNESESMQVDLPIEEEPAELEMDLDSLLQDIDGEELPGLDQEVEDETDEITDAALEALLDSGPDEDSMDLSGLLPEDVMEEEKVSEINPSEQGAKDESVAALFDEDGMDSELSDIMNLGLFGEGGGLFDLDLEESGEEPAEPDISVMDELPDTEVIVQVAAPKAKISIWKRLFGNIKDEKWEKQKAKEEKKEAERLAKKEAEKAAQKEAEAGEEGEGGEAAEAKIDPKEAKKAAKLAKKEEKARKKAEKKEERQRQKELAELEDDDEGRINRVGAAIVFVLVGLFGAGVIVGTDVFSYRTSVSRATDYFNEDEYEAAYMELHGLDLKEKDQELYEKVRMVMFVDKELSSFENYTGIRMYPEALHSLLKGLEKYDSHVEEAVALDVTEDYDKLRNRILKELSEEYDLTEEEAYGLIGIEDQAAYSKEVISIANES